LSNRMSSDAECRIFRYSVYDVQPSAITCMRYSEAKRCLAVARANGAIELWRHYEQRCWDQFGYIPGDPEERPIDALEWTKYNYLLSAGIDGQITQYNIDTCTPGATFNTGAGAVWSMRHHPELDMVAVGGEDGIIRLYEIIETSDDAEPCLIYSKSFERQESRILSLYWHPRGKQLCSTGVNTVRIWNAETGRMTRQLTLPKDAATDLMIWSCVFLRDNTLAVGDSLGRVTFYDGKLGALLHSFKIHEADVLSLGVSPNERQVFASGVDPLFVSFELIRINDEDRQVWRRSWGHKMHTHDVRCIETVGSLVLSAGVDAKVVVAKQKRKETDITKTSTILQSFRQTKICSLSREKGIFALQGESKIDLWKMSKVVDDEKEHQDGATLPSDGPVHLATLNTEALRVARLSPNGAYLAFSTIEKLRIYRLECENFNVQIQKCEFAIDKNDLPVLSLSFSADSTKLYYGNKTSLINVINLTDMIQTSPIHINAAEHSPLREIVIDQHNKHIVAMGLSHCYLYNIEQESHLRLPACTTAFTAMAFLGSTILACTASRDIHEFTMDGVYTEWSNSSIIPSKWRTYRSKLVNINQHGENWPILLCDNESFTVLDRSKPKKDYLRKIKNIELEKGHRDETRCEFTEVSRWKYVLHCEMFNKGDILLIERPVGEVMDALPPNLKQKKFALK